MGCSREFGGVISLEKALPFSWSQFSIEEGGCEPLAMVIHSSWGMGTPAGKGNPGRTPMASTAP